MQQYSTCNDSHKTHKVTPIGTKTNLQANNQQHQASLWDTDACGLSNTKLSELTLTHTEEMQHNQIGAKRIFFWTRLFSFSVTWFWNMIMFSHWHMLSSAGLSVEGKKAQDLVSCPLFLSSPSMSKCGRVRKVWMNFCDSSSVLAPFISGPESTGEALIGYVDVLRLCRVLSSDGYRRMLSDHQSGQCFWQQRGW